MKILYFHQHFSTPNGATGIRSYEMAKALIAEGHQVTMVCGSYQGGHTGLDQPFVKGKRTGTVDQIKIIEFELAYANQQSFIERSKVFIKFAWSSIKVALTESYDVIFTTTTPLTAAIPGIIAKHLKRKPFIFEVRDLWPELPREMGVIKNPVILKSLAFLEWLAYKSADKHIALSPGIKTGIERHLSPKFMATNSVAMIPNGCDLEIFNTKDDSWQPEGIADDDFVAVFSGTHGIANDLEQLLEVARELKQRKFNNIKIVLIGQGKQKATLMEKAKAEQLTQLIFLEPVNKHQLAKLFKRADVGLQVLANVPAFYFGTSPNKFFDYLSASLPVINNYPGWVAELITSHQCGIAVPPNNPKAFAEALLAMSLDKERQQKMAKNSLALAQSTFSRVQLSQEFVTVFEAS